MRPRSVPKDALQMYDESTSTESDETNTKETLLAGIDLSPRKWSECFDHAMDITLPSRNGSWRVYDIGFTADVDIALVLLHGGGHGALSWGLVAEKLKVSCPIVAFDARGHGHSKSNDDLNLSAETQVKDAELLIKEFLNRKGLDKSSMRLVICGHSMGGAIAIRLSASGLLPQIVGLIVIDVVEGTAMSALPYMSSWIERRLSSFSSVEKAIHYVIRAGHVRNADSARLSVPAQVKHDVEKNRWVWRTKLERTEQYWRGWFTGLSSLFLSVPAAKMLVLANVNRLDKDLMIAQMQGKFQNILIPEAGHAVHEDQPEQTAQAILEYLRRNLFISSEDYEEAGSVFQQRQPIPPCC